MCYLPLQTALVLMGILARNATAQIQAGSLYQPGPVTEPDPPLGKVFSQPDCQESEFDSGWVGLDECFYVQGGGRSYNLTGGYDGDYCLQRTPALPCKCGEWPRRVLSTGKSPLFIGTVLGRGETHSTGECVNLGYEMPELVQFAWIAGECDYCELDSSINSGVSDSPDPANP